MTTHEVSVRPLRRLRNLTSGSNGLGWAVAAYVLAPWSMFCCMVLHARQVFSEASSAAFIIVRLPISSEASRQTARNPNPEAMKDPVVNPTNT